MREIAPNVFQLRIVLPGSPLKYLNSYLVKGVERNLLVDTGINSTKSFNSLMRQLAKLKLKLQDLTDILVTHCHTDHIGLVHRLKSSLNVKFIMSEKEATLLSLMKVVKRSELATFYISHGVSPQLLIQIVKTHPAFKKSSEKMWRRMSMPDVLLKDCDTISIDGYEFQVTLTPGHTPGHICLYEPMLKLLISGDHILPTITSNISRYPVDGNPLEDYLDSLNRIEQLDIRIVLPAHEDIFMDCKGRIRQLREHHERRLNEILAQIKSRMLTAYDIASLTSWKVSYPSWAAFPLYEKFFAIGETLAHLKFLEEKGFVEEVKHNGLVYYRATTMETVKL